VNLFLTHFVMMQLLSHYPSSLFCRWFLLPCGNDAVASQPIGLSRDENKPCVVGYAFQFNLITKDQFQLCGWLHHQSAIIST
jgi:hypothetical protein